jgi:acetyl esterase/lipase
MFPASIRPPYDPELVHPFASAASAMPLLTEESLAAFREASSVDLRALLDTQGIAVEDRLIAGHNDDTVEVSVLRKGEASTGPLIYHTHGGGMILGNRWSGILPLLEWIDLFDAVVVTVEYRLAPEFPEPYPREDAYAGLRWTAENSRELTRGTPRIILAGQSAGGGIAAALALMARDRNGPRVHGQLLLSPMLDDRDSTVSARQFDGTGGWDRQANRFAWKALLGPGRGAGAGSPYAAPARATDLTGLPPAFLECGTAEVFRDETVAYATSLWSAGNEAELHMWAGGFHRYDQLAPETRIAADTVATRNAWLDRLLRS